MNCDHCKKEIPPEDVHSGTQKYHHDCAREVERARNHNRNRSRKVKKHSDYNDKRQERVKKGQILNLSWKRIADNIEKIGRAYDTYIGYNPHNPEKAIREMERA